MLYAVGAPYMLVACTSPTPPAPTTNQERREWQCGPKVHKHLSSSSRMVKFMWGELGEGGEWGGVLLHACT